MLDIALLSDPSCCAEADGASSLKEKRKFELEEGAADSEGVEARGGEGRKTTKKKRGKLRHSK